MKVYVTVTAPSRNAKSTVARLIAKALSGYGFDNLFVLDADTDRRSVGLFPHEKERVRTWAHSTPLYVLAVQGQVDRKEFLPEEREDVKVRIQREYDEVSKRMGELLTEAERMGIKLKDPCP